MNELGKGLPVPTPSEIIKDVLKDLAKKYGPDLLEEALKPIQVRKPKPTGGGGGGGGGLLLLLAALALGGKRKRSRR